MPDTKTFTCICKDNDPANPGGIGDCGRTLIIDEAEGVAEIKDANLEENFLARISNVEVQKWGHIEIKGESMLISRATAKLLLNLGAKEIKHG